MRPCADYLQAYESRDAGGDALSAEYLGYRDWMTGFVSGLSLATGEDVVRGLEPHAVMERVRVECEERPDGDFFNATMEVVRTLSVLR